MWLKYLIPTWWEIKVTFGLYLLLFVGLLCSVKFQRRFPPKVFKSELIEFVPFELNEIGQLVQSENVKSEWMEVLQWDPTEKFPLEFDYHIDTTVFILTILTILMISVATYFCYNYYSTTNRPQQIGLLPLPPAQIPQHFAIDRRRG